MKPILLILVLSLILALVYATDECTSACQEKYERYVAQQKTYYKHWGPTNDSAIPCPQDIMTNTNKCPSQFFACKGKCNNSNWDPCIKECWASLQDCCLANALSNAETLRSECLSKCEPKLLTDSFESNNIQEVSGASIFVAMIILVLTAYLLAGMKK